MSFHRHQHALDYLPLMPASFGWQNQPPCNEPITLGTLATYAAIAASAAGAIVSSNAQRTAAKQTEFNAEAQQKALLMERQRKEAELAENQKRLAVQERRERASQFSTLASSGFIATTGTPLAIMADTVDAQQQRRSDMSMGAELDIWGLDVQGDTLMQEARSSAAAQRGRAGATLLSGFGTAAGQGANLAGKYSKPKGDT